MFLEDYFKSLKILLVKIIIFIFRRVLKKPLLKKILSHALNIYSTVDNMSAIKIICSELDSIQAALNTLKSNELNLIKSEEPSVPKKIGRKPKTMITSSASLFSPTTFSLTTSYPSTTLLSSTTTFTSTTTSPSTTSIFSTTTSPSTNSSSHAITPLFSTTPASSSSSTQQL